MIRVLRALLGRRRATRVVPLDPRDQRILDLLRDRRLAADASRPDPSASGENRP